MTPFKVLYVAETALQGADLLIFDLQCKPQIKASPL